MGPVTKSQRSWMQATRLLSDAGSFNSERDWVPAECALLKSHGLGQTRLPKLAGNGDGPDFWKWNLSPATWARRAKRCGQEGSPSTEYANSLSSGRTPGLHPAIGSGIAVGRVASTDRLLETAQVFWRKREVEANWRTKDEEKRGKRIAPGQVDRNTTNGALIARPLWLACRCGSTSTRSIATCALVGLVSKTAFRRVAPPPGVSNRLRFHRRFPRPHGCGNSARYRPWRKPGAMA